MRNITCLVVLFCCFLALLPAAGCGEGESGELNYRHPRHGLSFTAPAGWELAQEKERGEALTLQVKDSEGKTSLVVSVFPATVYTREETIAEAEKMLLKSLYSPGEITREELPLSGADPVIVLSAEAGQREKVAASTAILFGKQRNALFTLVARQSAFPACREQLAAILESVKLE